MLKKLFYIILFSSLIFAPLAHAWMMVQFFDITVNENSVGGDANFSFHIQEYSHDQYNNLVLSLNKDFNIQTSGGSGSNFTSTVTGSSYYITQDPLPGWQNIGIACLSDNPLVTTTPITNGVLITPVSFSSITCNFTNSKQNSKTPVLIIPGTLGTEIWNGGERLWFNLDKMKNPLDGNSFMDPLAFKPDGTPLITGLIANPVLGQPVESFDYSKALITDLQNQGYTLNKDLFLFPYDWRDEIAKNANTFLKQQIDSILASTTASSLNVIAHSQGGLLIKKLLYDNPNYEQKINKLIFVGTPNLGTPSSAKILFYGDDLGVAKAGIALLNPMEVKKISQNMPAIYEMLPSREYFNHSNGYLGQHGLFGGEINNYDNSKNLLKSSIYGLNSGLIDSAENFHTSAFDNFDLTNSGIKTYSIMGCESPTIGRVFVNGADYDNNLQYVPGDGTVPLVSASNIGGATDYFILNPDDIHSTMLTLDSSRKKIENILEDDTSSVAGITTNPALCVYKGNKVSVHSPANLEIYDENGDHVGPNPDGTFDYQIPEVKYDILDHSKFAFLPEGHTYTIKLVATNSGSFGFYSSQINGSQTDNTAYYDSILITASSTATVVLNAQNNQTIQLDVNGNGNNIQTIQPSSILNSNQSQDLTPPISTSTTTGTMGSPGFYRTDVKINISALDPVVDNNASTTSGVLKTVYSLDNTATTTYQSTIPVTSEGRHTISFFSTDKAGNNELPQIITFTIDKTSPEAVIQFNSTLKDIQFTGTDNISTTSKVTVLDSINDILLTDQAGNTTDIKLKEKNRKVSMQSTIQFLSYNTVAQDVSKNTLAFLWTYDKTGSLTMLSQNVAAKKTYVILAIYNGKKTSLVGIDKTGVILKSITGLDLLKVTTSKGDLNWSY